MKRGGESCYNGGIIFSEGRNTSTETVGIPKKPRFFHGWWVVLVGFLGDFFMAGITVHSFSFFLKPMAQELGWTRTMIMVGTSMRTFASAFTGPFIGPLLDRHGARLVIVIGALLGGAGIMLLSQVHTLWQFYLIYGIAGAVGMVCIGGMVATSSVAKWFIRKRGRAIAIVTAGLPLGGAVLGPISQYIILHFSWRTAWVFLGATVWVVMIPLAWFLIRRTPEDIGLQPDGEAAPQATEQESATETGSNEHSSYAREEVWTLQEALKTPALWLIILAFDLSGMGLSATMLHQTAYISDKGLPVAVLATNMIIWGTSAALGSLFWGFLAEKIPIRYCVMAAFFVAAVGLTIFMSAQNMSMVLLYSVTFGVAAGASAPLNALTIANYYGRAFVGTIQGVSMPFRLISTAGGPLFAAYIYDATKSYDLAFTIFAATYLGGAFMILTARPPRPRRQTSRA